MELVTSYYKYIHAQQSTYRQSTGLLFIGYVVMILYASIQPSKSCDDEDEEEINHGVKDIKDTKDSGDPTEDSKDTKDIISDSTKDTKDSTDVISDSTEDTKTIGILTILWILLSISLLLIVVSTQIWRSG